MNSRIKTKIIGILIVTFSFAGIAGILLSIKKPQFIGKKASVSGGVARISLSPATGNYGIGDSFPVSIMFNPNGVAMSGIISRITYPYSGETPEVIASNIKINQDLLLSGNWLCVLRAINLNSELHRVEVDIACLYVNQDAPASGFVTTTNTLLAQFTLTVNRSPSANPVVLSFDPVETKISSKSDGADILATPDSGASYQIGGGIATATPLPVSTSTPIPTPTVPAGATNTPVPPTSTPNPQLFTWREEAENGSLTSPVAVASDANASACQYVSTGTNNIGSVEYAINVPTTGDYYLWARSKGIDWTHNSFFVSFDSGTPFAYEISQFNGNWQWGWEKVKTDPTDPTTNVFSLTAGSHTLRFAGREKNAGLDAVFLANNVSSTPPSTLNPCATPTPTTSAQCTGTCYSNSTCYNHCTGDQQCVMVSSESCNWNPGPPYPYQCCTGGGYLTPTPTVTNTPVSPTPTPTSVPCSCPAGMPAKNLGNANCDSVIDGIDFEIWREEYLGLRTITFADFNCIDGVNLTDFYIWQENRNK